MSANTNTFYEQVYAVVRRIPRGQVTSYGRVAQMLGHPNAARAVGYALGALRRRRKDPAYSDIPWQRVVNSAGRISSPNPAVQARILRDEGVVVNDNWQIDLDQFLWSGLHVLEIDDILRQTS